MDDPFYKLQYFKSSLVRDFVNNKSKLNGLFSILSLEEAISISCLNPKIKERKNLLLYFHNEYDNFQYFFFHYLQHSNEILDILKKYFYLIGWDITDKNDNYNLIEILKNVNLQSLEDIIKENKCSAVLITPFDDTYLVFDCLSSHNEDNLKKIILQSQSILIEYIQSKEIYEIAVGDTIKNFGPVEYLKLMYNQLSDRDYDRFEFNEHEYLKEKICYSIFGPPNDESGYDKKLLDEANKLYNVIVNESNKISKWKDRITISITFNCLTPLETTKLKRKNENKEYNPYNDFTTYPIFILRKCKNSVNPCRIFIDHTGRVYQTWNEYLCRNKLGEGLMILPANGRFATNSENELLIEKYLSPSCNISKKILNFTDIGSSVVGMASGGVLLASTMLTVPLAPVILTGAAVGGVATGIYSISRSAYSIYDRNRHNESLHITNSDARAAYFNIVAGSLGFVGAGSNMLLNHLIKNGINIDNFTKGVFDAINIANLGVSGGSVANSAVDIFNVWYFNNQQPSPLVVIQMASSILFFGHAVCNFRTTNQLIEDIHIDVVTKYQQLLNNKQKQMFNKMLKETIRLMGGDLKAANKEIILTLKNVNSVPEIFNVLSKSNKMFNKNNVRFSAKNGKIALNGIEVDTIYFNTNRNNLDNIVKTLPSIPEPHIANVKQINVKLEQSFLNNSINFIPTYNLSSVIISLYNIGLSFAKDNESIKNKIIDAFSELCKNLLDQFRDEIFRLFPDVKFYIELFNFTIKYFYNEVKNIEEKYKNWLKTKDQSYFEPYFDYLPLAETERLLEILKKVLSLHFIGDKLTENGLKKLLKKAAAWISEEIYSKLLHFTSKNKRSEYSNKSEKKCCPVCNGEFYEGFTS